MSKKLTDQFRPPKTKACNTCRVDKPLKEYYLVAENKDGRANKCITCLLEVENNKKEKQVEYAKTFFTF